MIAKRRLPFLALAAALLGLLLGTSAVRADTTEDSAKRDIRLALELFDLGEYDSAVKRIKGALERLGAKGLAFHEVAAEGHALLGVVYARGLGDDAKALDAFRQAAKIDAEIKLPEGRADDITKALFDKAYQEVHPTVDCTTLMGVSHEQLVTAREGTPTRIEAKIGKVLQDGSTMLVLYRGAAGGEYLEAPMKAAKGCTYAAEIPADKVVAPKLEYYLLARLADGRPAARRGKAEEPFVVNVSFGAQQVVDDESIGDGGEEAVEENPIDEVPAALGPAKAPKGSGCAGCSTEGGGGGGVVLLGVAMAALVGRRRRRA